jgi:hypothetical protein
MADNDNESGLVNVLGDLAHALQNQRLDEKQARRADKAILEELKRNSRYAKKSVLNRAGGVAKRAAGGALGAVGKAAGGFVAKEIGSIPIAGAIFKILGKKMGNASLERKQYKKTLVVRRKLEIKEMERMERIRAKLTEKQEKAAERLGPANKKNDGQEEHGGDGSPARKSGGGMSVAVEKLTEAAMHMQATSISMTPAIQTFHETVEKMAEVVDAMHDQKSNDPGKVRDAKLLEYLHGIDYLTQENAAIAENSLELNKSVAKDMGNIKWHTARQNGTVGRIEKLIQQKESGGDNKLTEVMAKDIGNIKWHVARLNGSSGRSEKLLAAAAADRIKELANQDAMIKLQKEQLDAQEESMVMSMAGSAASAVGSAVSGLGSAAMAVGGAAVVGGTAIAGTIAAALPEILAGAAIVTAVGALAYGVYKAVSASSWFSGNSQPKTLNGADPDENLKAANGVAAQNGTQDDPSYKTPEQIEYAKQNGRYADKAMYMAADPAKPGSFKASSEMYPWEHDRMMSQQETGQIGAKSAEVAEASGTLNRAANGNVTSVSNNHSQTTNVQTSPLSTSSPTTPGTPTK